MDFNNFKKLQRSASDFAQYPPLDVKSGQANLKFEKNIGFEFGTYNTLEARCHGNSPDPHL